MGHNSENPENKQESKSTYALRSIRDRLRFKRNPNPDPNPDGNGSVSRKKTGGRSHHQRSASRAKFSCLHLRGRSLFYSCIFLIIFVFALSSMMMQNSIMSVILPERARWRWFVRDDLKIGSSLRFFPHPRFHFSGGGRLDLLREQPRYSIRRPQLGLILGNMDKNPSSLMLLTVVENLLSLGYSFKVHFRVFQKLSCLRANKIILSIMLEPFSSVPLIWIIEEDTLAHRIQLYRSMGQEYLVSHWKTVLQRADAVVFSDFSFPMLYSLVDSGNFFVIPGSPRDTWSAESYSIAHSRTQLRVEYGFDKEDMLILVVGSSFFPDELSWNYAVTMNDIESLLVKYAGGNNIETFKFIFLCGNSSEEYHETLKDVSSRLGLEQGSLIHFGLDGDVNHLIMMADITLYASSQNEQGFPSMLIRAMSFGLPIVAPDYPVIKKYVTDRVHGLVFSKHKPGTLSKAFSLLIVKGKLSRLAHSIASSGKLLAKNMLAAECITEYALLLENIVNFPSDVLLPGHISEITQKTWEWNYFQDEIEKTYQFQEASHLSSAVYELEEEITNHTLLKNETSESTDILVKEFPTRVDWDILGQIERAEELENVETQEIEERTEMDIGEWDEIYRNARKAEKLKFETNERDEGELERTGQPVCIYEIYKGAGAWPFLHHGSMYRGLSLSTKTRRLTSDDVDAADRLPLLNDSYYSDLLCEISGMFSVAYRIDDIHKRPWIGFQSWRAAGRMVSLSTKAEKVLERTIRDNTNGDVLYFWGHLNMEWELLGSNNPLSFWSMCDILNGENCRSAFEDAFRRMYALPLNVEALPPMPEDDGHWSALHSWVMPTSSFLEFVMFSRMFVDALHTLHVNSKSTSQCLFGSSNREKQHCYCQVLELLVNVWAYHSARRMVFIDPNSGFLQEHHPVEQRKKFMWTKYFNFTLLKSMDEDLAEAAEDNDHPYEMWLWPLIGEVYWQGTYEREREERYRMKMDKKRKIKEKLLERMKYGYKQRTLAG
ncbi:hypothetical protein Leryth_026899 [Lithospermum erythrorhizon]|nr:hypothetical protein Leryth_026899 [Lithospermum erythrorhizon]